MNKSKINIIQLEPEWELLRSLELMIFKNQWITTEKFQRLKESENLLLVAQSDGKPVGFKVGYKVDSYTFHSWLGGVKQDHRRQGIAQALMNEQEKLVRSMGMKRITFNTFDKFSAMIRLGEKNGYQLIDSKAMNGSVKYYYEKFLEF